MRVWVWFVAVMLLAASCGVSFAEKPLISVKTAWKGGHETFLVWYAKQKKWDRDVGLDVQLIRFESSRKIINGVLAYDWDIAGCGAVPVIASPLRSRVCVVGIAGEAIHTSTIFTRKAHPVLNTRGFNPDFPEIYGSPETVQGKVIICSRNSPAQYMLDRWLATLGMTERDVRIRYMDSESALKKFVGGVGDLIALGSSETTEAGSHGLQIVAQSMHCGVRQPLLLVANRTFTQTHGTEISAFLKMYLRSVNAVRSMQPEALADDYRAFVQEWSGKKITSQDAIIALNNVALFTLQEQIALLNPQGGPGTLLANLNEMIDFVRQIRDRGQDTTMNTVLQPGFVEDRFLLSLRKRKAS